MLLLGKDAHTLGVWVVRGCVQQNSIVILHEKTILFVATQPLQEFQISLSLKYSYLSGGFITNYINEKNQDIEDYVGLVVFS